MTSASPLAPAPNACSEQRQYARELVADWPPLTSEQRTRIAVLLQPSPISSQHAAAARRKRKAA